MRCGREGVVAFEPACLSSLPCKELAHVVFTVVSLVMNQSGVACSSVGGCRDISRVDGSWVVVLAKASIWAYCQCTLS